MISIIIPIYNVEQYIQRCLDSILKQTYQDFEIICVNDCSTDNSLDVITEYSNKFDKIKVYTNESNSGSGHCRNRGIQLSTGEYILFIDSDDYVEPDYLEKYLETIIKYDADMVVGGYTRDKGEKQTTHHISDSDWSILTYTMPWAKLLKRDFVISNNIRFSDTKRTQDVFFSVMTFCCNAKYKVIPYCGYHYFCNNTSITKNRKLAKEQEEYISENFRLIQQESSYQNLSLEKKQKVEYTYIADMVNSLITYGTGCGIKRMISRYKWINNDMNDLFKDYSKNPLIGISKPKGQTLKIRLGVGVMMRLKKVKLDLPLYLLISII